MPKYRVQLKQGSTTKTAHIEAKSVAAVLDFYNTLTTMQVSEILKVEYVDETLPPIDDMAYYQLCKFFYGNDDSRKSQQFYFQNMKLTKNTDDVILKAKQCLEIDGLNCDAVRSFILKNSKLFGQ
ncbi:MAG: hypothetical protein M0P91_09675 [Sulfuricurvum sp.]|jgi:hypothetical protein|uniref:hypothetical protein n=1 Tax=Sulfuricurvum sp. TaxID=2025608 RepID=UPI0025D1FE06|nr:hypothetical protein [Sulfuricurvum sp.]MCK9373457.1 hypothetical protein [Sulfuricurvum sp.]